MLFKSISKICFAFNKKMTGLSWMKITYIDKNLLDQEKFYILRLLIFVNKVKTKLRFDST